MTAEEERGPEAAEADAPGTEEPERPKVPGSDGPAGNGAPDPDAPESEDPGPLGPILLPEQGDALERADRKRPIPGGEPECPDCGAPMLRHVERHPAPRGDASPFRVRLVCTAPECRRWTVYDW